MPKPKWVGKKPGVALEAKDFVSKSAPLLLKPNVPGPLTPFVPIVWDLAATVSIKTNDAIVIAAQNIGQMVRENPDQGLMLLQSLPTDATARKVFITALNEALKNTSWEIATDAAPAKSVLTLFNKTHLKKETPTLAAAAPVLAGAPESHRVDWFSLVGHPDQCYCVGNMQYKSTVTAAQIKADYEAFDDAYYKRKRYTHQAHRFKIIFAGALGNALKADTEIDFAKVFVAPEKNLTTSSVILDRILNVKRKNVTATPIPAYNRRDAAVYPGEKGYTANDMWTESDIPAALATADTYNISEVNVKITEENNKQFKKAITPNGLQIFSNVNKAEDLKDNQENLATIFKNIARSFKAAFKPAIKTDDIPARIKLVVPIHWGSEKSGHYTPLCFDIGLNKDEFVKLINNSDWTDDTVFSASAFKACVTATTAQLMESTSDAYLTPTNKAALEKMLCQFVINDLEIQNTTPFIQRDLNPDSAGIDCGPITTEQSRRFLANEAALTIPGYPDTTKWKDDTVWNAETRKAYAADSYRIGLELRRKFLQQCGAGQAEPDRIKASKPDARKKGEPTREELVQRNQKKDIFDKILEKYGYSESSKENSKAVLNKADDKGNKSILYSRNDKGDTLTTEKTSPQIAQLMALDLLSQGFDKVEITCSETNQDMYMKSFVQAGFDPSKVFIKIQVADPTPDKSRDSMQSPFPGMM